MPRFGLTSAILYVASWITEPVSGSTIHVPTDQPTISAAITAAAADDIVAVSGGTYFEHDLFITQRIVLLGDPGHPSSTIIDGQNLGRILSVTFDDGPVEISGFTFRNGHAASPYPGTLGGAIYAQAPFLVISDCVFENNIAETVNNSVGVGGAIFVESISAIARCAFRVNRAYSGGAIFAHFTSLILEECDFMSNSAQGGGAVMIRDNGSPVITDCSFSDNEAVGGGALVLGWYVAPQVENCVFLRNSATGEGATGGAVMCFSNANPTFERCLFAKNTSSFAGFLGFGGAIGTNTSFLSINSCTLADNVAPTGSAVYSNISVVHFDRSIIAFNHPGSVAYCTNGAGVLTATCTDVFGNLGGDWSTCLPNQDQSNFSADPHFCDRLQDDYTLQVGSPCAPPGETGCGLVGAFHEACGPIAVDAATWGKIKSKYR